MVAGGLEAAIPANSQCFLLPLRIGIENLVLAFRSGVFGGGRWLARVKPESQAVRVGFFLLLAAVGTMLWASVNDTGADPADQHSLVDYKMRSAAAFASVVISEGEAPRLGMVVPIPSSINLRPGETTIFTAAAFDQFARELDNVTYNWQLIAPAAGTITPSGVFHAGPNEGFFRGAVVVEASPLPGVGWKAIQGSIDIIISGEVREKVPASIRLFPEFAEVEPGRTLHLIALGVDAEDTFLPGVQPLWEMVNSRAGSISPTGRFTAGEAPGSYAKAILVTLPTGQGGEGISTLMDVRVLETPLATAPIILAILPQTAILRPGQVMEFAGVAMDLGDGRRLEDIQVRWLTLNPIAGTVYKDGQFQASQRPGVYPNAVQASITLPAQDGDTAATITARATVTVLDPTATEPQTALPDRIWIFPEQVVLSPGESTRLAIIGLGDHGRNLSGVDVQWHLDPQLGEIAPFIGVRAGVAPGGVKAGSVPGVYPGAIRAIVTVETDAKLITHEVSANLVIRGPLAVVSIEPGTATLTSGQRIQFQAQARDASGTLLPDVYFRWSVVDEKAGEFNVGGSFVAGQELGEYQDVVKVEAVQRIKEP